MKILLVPVFFLYAVPDVYDFISSLEHIRWISCIFINRTLKDDIFELKLASPWFLWQKQTNP